MTDPERLIDEVGVAETDKEALEVGVRDPEGDGEAVAVWVTEPVRLMVEVGDADGELLGVVVGAEVLERDAEPLPVWVNEAVRLVVEVAEPVSVQVPVSVVEGVPDAEGDRRLLMLRVAEALLEAKLLADEEVVLEAERVGGSIAQVAYMSYVKVTAAEPATNPPPVPSQEDNAYKTLAEGREVVNLREPPPSLSIRISERQREAVSRLTTDTA